MQSSGWAVRHGEGEGFEDGRGSHDRQQHVAGRFEFTTLWPVETFPDAISDFRDEAGELLSESFARSGLGSKRNST